MLGFDSIGLQVFFRKILQIERHNEVSARADCSSQNMSVIRVRQRDGVDERLVASHKAIPDMGVQQVASSLKLFRLHVRTVFENVPHPLVVDGIGPFGAVKFRDRDMPQQVAKRSRIEDARVIQNGVIAHFNSPCRVPEPGPPIRPVPSTGCDPLPACTPSSP